MRSGSAFIGRAELTAFCKTGHHWEDVSEHHQNFSFLCEEVERQFLHGWIDFYSIVIYLIKTPQQNKRKFETIQKCHSSVQKILGMGTSLFCPVCPCCAREAAREREPEEYYKYYKLSKVSSSPRGPRLLKDTLVSFL